MGKAGGYDKLQYEHFSYAKDALSPILANVFMKMLRAGYIPDQMKRGVIVTLHKGGNKRKDRDITLTSVILKVYEEVERIYIIFHQSQQGGFQDGLSCFMTSFILRESIYFSSEYNSKAYVCFMDRRKAFDVVWHDGLMYTLISETDIDVTTLLAFKALYTNMTSFVNYMGKCSDWFPVKQAGKTSPTLYLLFINGLIYEIEHSGFGLCMFDMPICCPTVADDKVLLSYSVQGLNSLLAICDRCPNKWRYNYNSSTCAVIVINERQCNINENRQFKLGDNGIAEATDYVHLGIKCDKYLSTQRNVDDACTKLRGTLLSINRTGLSLKSIHPLSPRTTLRLL